MRKHTLFNYFIEILSYSILILIIETIANFFILFNCIYRLINDFIKTKSLIYQSTN